MIASFILMLLAILIAPLLFGPMSQIPTMLVVMFGLLGVMQEIRNLRPKEKKQSIPDGVQPEDDEEKPLQKGRVRPG